MATGKTWIVVADAARAKIYCQPRAGAPLEPALDRDFAGNRTKASETGDDRPGRVHERHGSERHGMEPTSDPKRQAQRGFAEDLASELRRAADEGALDHVVLVAPPQMLGDLRGSLEDRVRDKIIGELDKDLAKLGIHELAPHLGDILHFAG
jgi:protein required for attachment to host cells